MRKGSTLKRWKLIMLKSSAIATQASASCLLKEQPFKLDPFPGGKWRLMVRKEFEIDEAGKLL